MTDCDGPPSSDVEALTAVGSILQAIRSISLILNRSEFSWDGERRATHSCGLITCSCESTRKQEGEYVMPVTLLDKLTAQVGFIGLGLMGSRLTRRLDSFGWHIRAWNRTPNHADELNRWGITIAPSNADLTAESNVIFSSLANDAAVRSVYLDSDGVFSTAIPGTIILEMSTISPELSRRLHQEARTRGIKFLDVAISGSTPAVEAGTITLLAGGDKETFEQCVPIFDSIARQWFLIGPGSSGVQMKLVVNLLLGLDMQAIAEAVSLGEHLQIDRNVLLRVLSKTAVIAPAIVGKLQKIKTNDYSPEFPLRLMSKDMDLVMDAARASGADLPAASVAQSTLASNVRTNGDLDLSAITPYVVGHRPRLDNQQVLDASSTKRSPGKTSPGAPIVANAETVH
jgi:3-hydroxyisobutyrate dehydrogenase-like beta-hydroxyacid dehydrogenase